MLVYKGIFVLIIVFVCVYTVFLSPPNEVS